VKIQSDEFKELQKHWYQRLKDDGFKDIEYVYHNESSVIRRSKEVYRRCTDATDIQTKEDYFRLLSQSVNNDETIFRSEVDKYVLTRYSEGARTTAIVQELKALGMSRDRRNVLRIIRKYEKEWKIRR
jgi:hypothetical protein